MIQTETGLQKQNRIAFGSSLTIMSPTLNDIEQLHFTLPE